jgi:regulator of protease activity HflC (stomatin/prohibitin superfamily)
MALRKRRRLFRRGVLDRGRRLRAPRAYGMQVLMLSALPLTAVAVLWILYMALKIVREYERGVILRLGRLVGTRGPGLVFVFPFIEQMIRMDLRTITHDVPSQDVITRDNVSVKVSAVLYFRVVDPAKAVIDVQNYYLATSQLAQTTLRSVCGQVPLDAMLADRDRLNDQLQEIIDASTEPWGVKVMLVEIKHIDLPADMQRAMARQAEAERLRRAKVISAEGEFQAAARLGEAAGLMEKEAVAMQLRMLQTLSQVGTEKNRTVVMPIPIDLIRMMFQGNR